MEKRLVGNHGGDPTVCGHENGLAQLVVPEAIAIATALESIQLDILVEEMFPDGGQF